MIEVTYLSHHGYFVKKKKTQLFLSVSEIGKQITSCKFSVAFGWIVYGWNEFLMIVAQKYEKTNKKRHKCQENEKPPNETKYVQMTDLIRECCPKYTKNS